MGKLLKEIETEKKAKTNNTRPSLENITNRAKKAAAGIFIVSTSTFGVYTGATQILREDMPQWVFAAVTAIVVGIVLSVLFNKD